MKMVYKLAYLIHVSLLYVYLYITVMNTYPISCNTVGEYISIQQVILQVVHLLLCPLNLVESIRNLITC